jgi:ATP-binding cassette subfamily B protein
MQRIRRLIRELLGPYRAKLATRVVIAALIAATPYAFTFLGKWLVDEALQVAGPPKPRTEAVADAQSGVEVGGVTIAWKAKTTEEKIHLLALFLAASLALHLVTSGLGAFSELLNSRTVQQLAYDLRARVHGKLAGADMAYFSREQVGQLMTRVMDDAGGIPGNLTNLVINLCTQTMMLILGVVLLVRLNPKMTLVAVAALPFYAVTCLVFLPRLKKNTEDIRLGGAQLNGYLVERLSNVATVKNYAQEEREISRFAEHVQRQTGLARRQNRLNLVFGTCTTLITGFATLSVLAIGFLNLKSQRMQLGEVMAFYQVTAQLFVPISALVGLTTVGQTLEVLAQRVFSVLDAPSSLATTESPLKAEDLRGRISFENVSLRYQEGGPFAVQDIQLEIPVGSTTCIVGPTGCGKSTLIALLTRLYDPTEGTIRLDGADLRQLPLRQLRRAIGNVLQDAEVFTGTIAENITYGAPDASRKSVEEVAKLVDLHGFVMGQKKGYDTRLGRGGIALDKEELIKLNLARALMTHPAVLTVDDTFAGLEDTTEERLREALRRTLRQETVLIATSRLSSCEEADLVVVMRKGRIVETGTHHQLLAQPGLYRRMYMRQMGITEEMLA